MNERIDQLFGQALDQAVPETWTTLTPAQLLTVKDRFAELIIKECADIATKNQYQSFTVGHYIKKHFGVE
jgi:hypothetical protein